ncbi:MAG: GNAT family N-acetyltransferase [Kiloniellales bacterium]
MTAADSLAIRLAGPADTAALAGLVRGLLQFERYGKQEHVTPEAVAAWIGGAAPAIEVLLAEQAGSAVGYLAFYRAFSLFRGGPVLLVENLYVAEEARGRGVGRRLLAAAAAEAEKRGYGRIELHVRADNPESRAFYRRVGFFEPGEAVCRIEDTALARLAREDYGEDYGEDRGEDPGINR